LEIIWETETMTKNATLPVTPPATTETPAAENGSTVPKSETVVPFEPTTPPVQTAPAPAAPALVVDQEKAASSWPPPLYLPGQAGEAEKHYIRHRWQSQWLWYDSKSSENKRKHQLLQVLIGVGSVSVPVLLNLQEPWRNFAVVISLVVAAAASVENVKKYGDNWRSYRRAAENLSREKSLFDVNAGPYRTTKVPFTRFVERCEEVIAQQNGQFYQRGEDQQTQTQSREEGERAAQNEETPTDEGAAGQ
jgi:hypothetical protein